MATIQLYPYGGAFKVLCEFTVIANDIQAFRNEIKKRMTFIRDNFKKFGKVNVILANEKEHIIGGGTLDINEDNLNNIIIPE